MSLATVGDMVVASRSDLVSAVQVGPVDLLMALAFESFQAVREAGRSDDVTVQVLDDRRFDPRCGGDVGASAGEHAQGEARH